MRNTPTRINKKKIHRDFIVNKGYALLKRVQNVISALRWSP
jgi:hypothetical protein